MEDEKIMVFGYTISPQLSLCLFLKILERNYKIKIKIDFKLIKLFLFQTHFTFFLYIYFHNKPNIYIYKKKSYFEQFFYLKNDKKENRSV